MHPSVESLGPPADGFTQVVVSIALGPIGVTIAQRARGFCVVVKKRIPSSPLNIEDRILAINGDVLSRYAGVDSWHENIKATTSEVRRVVVDRPLADATARACSVAMEVSHSDEVPARQSNVEGRTEGGDFGDVDLSESDFSCLEESLNWFSKKFGGRWS